MHAEATSEKVGMGWHLDGRVTAVVGTHTHVPTADARVLPGGTAYITDVGMTGPRGGVIGVKREQAIEAMVTKMPVRFETSTEDPWLNGVLITAAERADAGGGDRAGARARARSSQADQPADPHAHRRRLRAGRAPAAARRGRRRSGMAGEQRHHHQREEPHDVGVQPVVDA